MWAWPTSNFRSKAHPLRANRILRWKPLPRRTPNRRRTRHHNPDMDLQSIREKIDRLDVQLVQVLNERLTLAAEIGKLKRSQGGQIYVAEREDAVLRKVTGQNQGPIKHEAL